MPKTLVISAVNIIEGGTLTVLRDCVDTASKLLKGWRIIVMAHDFGIINIPGVEVQIFPRAKASWLFRIWLEWIGFKNISQEIQADLWLSLHDITPRVNTSMQVVYCHNPAIFYNINLREAFFEPKLLLFKLFYGFIYRTFVRRNRYVIVQQQWIRDEFNRRFGNLPIIVAQPCVKFRNIYKNTHHGQSIVFFYPALPRVFKNIEVLGQAAEILYSRGVCGFEIRLTMSGKENRYARWLKDRFRHMSTIRFIGRQNYQQMQSQYLEASAVVFSSKLETWGLPLTEAKLYGIPLIVADLPYAHETVGTYDAVSFFPANKPEILANLMQDLIEKKWKPTGNIESLPSKPFAKNWSELLQMIVMTFKT